MNENKSRNLSTLEYIKVLEVEWWINSLKRKIYPSKVDKGYYTRVTMFKKSRIIDMSDRNQIPHIFNDNDKMKELNKRLSPVGGCPEFEGRTDLDLINYYLPNSDVRCFYGFENRKPLIKVGKIISFDIKIHQVEVQVENEQAKFLTTSSVTRIF